MGFKIKSGNANGPASYNPASPPTVAIDGISAIDTSTDVVSVQVNGRRTGRVNSISGNVVAVAIFQVQSAGSGVATALTEVASGTNLSGERIIVTVQGY